MDRSRLLYGMVRSGCVERFGGGGFLSFFVSFLLFFLVLERGEDSGAVVEISSGKGRLAWLLLFTFRSVAASSIIIIIIIVSDNNGKCDPQP